MARKTKTVTIDNEGRDKGRSYLITEMPATKAENWAARALFSIAKSNPDIPEDVSSAGMAGIAVLGVRALLSIPWVEAEPLMSEMFECVQIQTSAGIIRKLMEDDIEEVSTRVHLRAEVADVHLGFSLAAELSKVGAAIKSLASTSPTPTSPKASAQS